MTRAATRSRTRAADRPAADLSPEVRWYLAARGYAEPTNAPAVRTPEPRDVEGAYFDPARVDRVIAALRCLRHTQGRWAGQSFEPDAWQVAYVIAPVFGWVAPNDDGDVVRIIRELYVDVPRKNGKTTLAAGLALYLAFGDREPGAQVYAVAASKDQARYCYDPAKTIAEHSPELRRSGVKPGRDRIVQPRSASYFAVVASVGDTLHGGNVHGAVVDELHVHKNPDVVDAVESGTGARRQPLVVTITTADDGRPGTIYARKRRMVDRLARGIIHNPSVYGVVFAADERDDPLAEATWAKANPGYGVSPTREFLRNEALKAQTSAADLAKFKRLHLGLRTKQETRYLDMPVWDRNAGKVDEAALEGRECYGGLDLANTSDLCALAWTFPDGDGGFDTVWRFWVPERAFERMVERLAGEPIAWREKGFLQVTPGDVADYAWIREQINRDRERFDVVEVRYDPWNSSQLVTDLLDDEAPMVSMRQGYASLSPPTKALKHTLLAGTKRRPRYRHGGNPVMRWQVDNLAVAMDPSGNVKPDKGRSADKIDGFAAAVMALDAAINRDADTAPSAYEDGGLMTV